METFVLDLPKNATIGAFTVENGHYITFDEYLDMDIECAILEWEDGRVIGYMSNNLRHQLVLGFLFQLMSLFAERHRLGEVIQAGYAMKLEALKRGREPDLVFVAAENLVRLRDKYLDGAADIAVEIVSPESGRRDRKTKFLEYQAAGIREYWLIDPQRKEAVFYRLDSAGVYASLDTPEGIFRSDVMPGFFLRVDWLWADRPSTTDALEELLRVR